MFAREIHPDRFESLQVERRRESHSLQTEARTVCTRYAASHYFRPGKLSFPICLWNQLPVTSSARSPAERSGRGILQPPEFPQENPPFLSTRFRGRQTSRPIFNLLSTSPGVCLSAFLSELSNPGGKTGGLFESETRRLRGIFGMRKINLEIS